MSQRTLRLPFRSMAGPKSNGSQWICKRCLATEVQQQASSAPPMRVMRNATEADNYDPKLPASLRDYRLNKVDFFLKKPLPQTLPVQYLQHSTSDLLHASERAQRENVEPHRRIVGVVVRSGKMDKTVTVRVPKKVWNKRVRKHYQSYDQHLVHDPNNSLVTGDVISLHRLRVSTAVNHVVAAIESPFGTEISDRAPIPSADDRLSAYKQKRFAKFDRRLLRRKAAMGDADAIKQLRDMGLDPGKGVEPLKGETANLEKGAGRKRTPTEGAIRGKKGQKLPEGVLPGGRAEVGKINDRAQRNKGQAQKFKRQAEGNVEEAMVKDNELARRGLARKGNLGRQNPVYDSPGRGEARTGPRSKGS